jgi:hypothetical protein
MRKSGKHMQKTAISPELQQGIENYHKRIDAMGGYGIRIRAVMPNGVVREGFLTEGGFGGCQPRLVDDAGKHWAVSLDSVEVV